MSQEFAAMFHGLLSGSVSQTLEEQFPFYPLTAPGMPLPGPDFAELAVNLGDPPLIFNGKGDDKRLESCGNNLHYLYRRALYDESFTMPLVLRGAQVQASLVPGHLFYNSTAGFNGGPRAARIMLLGKHPGNEEVQRRQNFVGPTSQELFRALDDLGVSEAERATWYCTNLLKWSNIDRQSDRIPDAWWKDCAILLEQELRLVRPDFILCLGSDAAKHLLGKSFGVQSMVGRVSPLSIPIFERGQEPLYHPAKVMAVVHPAAVYRRPELYDEFRDQIGLFLSLTNGADVGGRERFIRHRNITKARELEKVVNEIRSDPNPERRIIAIDAEWEGRYPTEPGSYLRTIQFSSSRGEGYVVVLRHQGGTPAFQPSRAHAIQLLNRLCKTDAAAGYYPRLGGHFLRADLPWLIYEGLDIRPEYFPAATPEDCRTAGGWDTSLAYHAVNETAAFGLESLMTRLTTAPRYDLALEEYKQQYCADHGITAKDLDGYGFIPSWILHPEPYESHNCYAAYDSDICRRIIMRLIARGGLLDTDSFTNSSWEPYWRSHRASLAVLEMEMNGILVDKNRMDQLAVKFVEAFTKLLEHFRAQIHWPEFNPDSYYHRTEFLFGEQHSPRRDKETGERISVRPLGARSLYLTPVTSTGKRKKMWADLVARNEAQLHQPCTDKEVLGILGHAHPLAMILRDLSFIRSAVKGVLRPPTLDEATGDPKMDEDGNYEYEAGLAEFICADGRVRTHISQCKETGRASSARPNLQAISKRREDDYARILGTLDDAGQPKGAYLDVLGPPQYIQPIRTVLKASPGCVLVEADLTGAELAALAWVSGDPQMIEDVRRNLLPEDHPDYSDIHSNTAVRAFQLSIEPTKKALKKAGRSGLRVAAKNVNFGVPYGREAPAIARQCREEGTNVSDDQAQRLIDFYFNRYPRVRDFLTACQSRSQDPRWVASTYGRFRRFVASRDRQVVGEQERQAQNFPIQSLVADAIWTALANFVEYRWQHPEARYKLLLQIHDAILFEVPFAHLREFKTVILPECMRNRVPVWPRHPDNTPIPLAEPYYFGNDIEVYQNWGQKITEADAVAQGIDPELV
jgi:uracil-DNA glycosylase family 4